MESDLLCIQVQRSGPLVLLGGCGEAQWGREAADDHSQHRRTGFTDIPQAECSLCMCVCDVNMSDCFCVMGESMVYTCKNSDNLHIPAKIPFLSHTALI